MATKRYTTVCPHRGLPALDQYGEPNSLRPNPSTADPSRGDHAFLQETILVGHFLTDGSAQSWGASARIVSGLPKPGSHRPLGVGLTDEVTKPRRDIRRPGL